MSDTKTEAERAIERTVEHLEMTRFTEAKLLARRIREVTVNFQQIARWLEAGEAVGEWDTPPKCIAFGEHNGAVDHLVGNARAYVQGRSHDLVSQMDNYIATRRLVQQVRKDLRHGPR